MTGAEAAGRLWNGRYWICRAPNCSRRACCTVVEQDGSVVLRSVPNGLAVWCLRCGNVRVACTDNTAELRQARARAALARVLEQVDKGDVVVGLSLVVVGSDGQVIYYSTSLEGRQANEVLARVVPLDNVLELEQTWQRCTLDATIGDTG
jgi:hypothetical protein